MAKNQRAVYPQISWGKNYNTVRHTPKQTLGTTNFIIMMIVMAFVAGLVYITQGPRGTGYDYDLKTLNDEVSRYEAMRDDLALENARLTGVVASENAEVLASMDDAGMGVRVDQ
jgi:hypothetical protein